jgi:acyl-CoA synthetase (AMP-forming)/AMP-acid ligase II
MKGGFIASPYNPRLNEEELQYIIDYSQAKVIFCGPEFLDMIPAMLNAVPQFNTAVSIDNTDQDLPTYTYLLDQYPSIEPDPEVTREDSVLILYTGGTTGTPRGALFNHQIKMENTKIKALQLGLDFRDRNLVVLPMFHTAQDSHMWPFFLTGGCNVIMPKGTFDPNATIKLIQEENITDTHIVPTQLIAILNDPEIENFDLGNTKRIYYAGAPMPTEVLKRGLSIFGPVFMQGFGQTETGPQIAHLKTEVHNIFEKNSEEQKVLTSVGQPDIGTHLRIVDFEGHDLGPGEIGEIIVQSNKNMLEYWRKPEETEAVIRDGWLYTGDMGYYDSKGYIYLADRKKDLIITGGENVYPKEVENILYKHPSVAEVAVIGLPDDYWGERVHAVIILNKNASVTAEEIIAFSKKHIASFKAPKTVDFVDSFPMSPQGKVLKRKLKKQYLNQN